MRSAEKLNETFTSIDCLPTKKVWKDREVGYRKRKFNEAKDQLASTFSVLIPGPDDLTICNDCDVLMRQVKEQFLFSMSLNTWLELQEMSKKRKVYKRYQIQSIDMVCQVSY